MKMLSRTIRNIAFEVKTYNVVTSFKYLDEHSLMGRCRFFSYSIKTFDGPRYFC